MRAAHSVAGTTLFTFTALKWAITAIHEVTDKSGITDVQIEGPQIEGPPPSRSRSRPVDAHLESNGRHLSVCFLQAAGGACGDGHRGAGRQSCAAAPPRGA